MKVKANGINIEVEDTGPEPHNGAERPVVLLIMGLGMQLVAWPPTVVQSLVNTGYRVITFDNRDIGLSQHFDHLGTPNLVWVGINARLGWRTNAPYTLHEMALDSIGVLDAFGVGKAHVVGVSMGGMIAQRVALAAPARVLSLTSIMSSSGARTLPTADAQVLRALSLWPVNGSRAALVAHYVRLHKAIESPGFPTDEAKLRLSIVRAMERSSHPSGAMRQSAAIAGDTTRARELASIDLPTLVLHGQSDLLVPFAHGQDTARRIRGARLAGIEGMGHDLAAGVVDRLLLHMAAFMLEHR